MQDTPSNYHRDQVSGISWGHSGLHSGRPLGEQGFHPLLPPGPPSHFPPTGLTLPEMKQFPVAHTASSDSDETTIQTAD